MKNQIIKPEIANKATFLDGTLISSDFLKPRVVTRIRVNNLQSNRFVTKLPNQNENFKSTS